MTSMYESLEDMQESMSRNPSSARFLRRIIKTIGITLGWYVVTYYLFLPKSS